MCSEYGREQLHMDLSQCSHWIRMMEIWYKRTETSRGEKCDYQEVTIVFMPDIWSGAPLIPTLLQSTPKSMIPEASTDVIAAEAAAAAVLTPSSEATPPKDESESGSTNDGNKKVLNPSEENGAGLSTIEEGEIVKTAGNSEEKVTPEETSPVQEEMEEEDDVPLNREGLTMLRVSDLRMLLKQRGLVTSVSD